MNVPLRPATNLWEGIFAADFTLDRIRRYSYHLGQTLLTQNLRCLVAYDTRFMSNLFAHDIYRQLARLGVAANLVSAAAPLPALQLALEKQQLDCALVVTARNRPYWYNGLVLLQPPHTQLTLEPGDDDPTATAIATAQPFPAPAESSPPRSGSDRRGHARCPQALPGDVAQCGRCQPHPPRHAHDFC